MLHDLAAQRLRPLRLGLVLSFLSFVIGFGSGALFGANEDGLKGSLREDGEAALATVYKGDKAKMEKVLAKSWSYMKRGHLHAGVLGACALAIILLIALLKPPGRFEQILALMLGIGAPVYGLYWFLAACKAPGLGSTGAAKDALEVVAILGSGGCILGMAGALFVTIKSLYGRSS